MNPILRISAHATALCWAACICLSAQTPLAASSPFSSPGSPDFSSDAPGGELQLRGVMGTADGPQFCIYDTTRRRSVWVGVGEAGYPFVVSSADLANDAVAVEWRGQRILLSLRRARTNSSVDGIAALQAGESRASAEPDAP